MALPLDGARVWAKTAADDLAAYQPAKFAGQSGAKLVVELDASGAKAPWLRDAESVELLTQGPNADQQNQEELKNHFRGWPGSGATAERLSPASTQVPTAGSSASGTGQ